jgi:hypothetical protein
MEADFDYGISFRASFAVWRAPFGKSIGIAEHNTLIMFPCG